MLPARMVLDYDEDDGTWRTYLETINTDGAIGFQYGRHFETEGEAMGDFEVRAGRL